MVLLFVCGVLFLLGIVAGLEGGSRRTLGPSAAIMLSASLLLAMGLARWVLAIDPKRDIGAVPLPPPWSSVVLTLALGLTFGLPIILGGFIGFSTCDFVHRRASRWLRLVGYAIVFVCLTALAPWVFGVIVD